VLSSDRWKQLAVFAAAFLAGCAQPEAPINACVAANFTEPAKEIARLFQQATGHKVALSFGSTGQLLTQIMQNAPFDVFLAADEASPKKVAGGGFGIGSSIFTYSVGKVVLYSASLDLTNAEATLRNGKFQKIAIANPNIAPYGAAAVETMKSINVYEQLLSKVVQGNNITQAFQFVETGNAELGFVALSQVLGKDRKSIWIVPDSMYAPIRQDAVLLKSGSEKDAARAFMAFLKSSEAVKVIEKYGYGTAP
jgi:molybdate transport system substrate-binding protein